MCYIVQFDKEFQRMQPDAQDFFVQWTLVAPQVISFCEQRSNNADLRQLLAELTSSEDGSDVSYKPPQC